MTPSLFATAAVPAIAAQPTRAEALYQISGTILHRLIKGHSFDAGFLAATMTAQFGGTDAEGAWQWKDAYEAVEMAFVRFIQQFSGVLRKLPPERMLAMLVRLHAFCPTQTRRSDESQAMQQFSTPLTIGLAALMAADPAPGETVLEPSAGTGMLAALAQMQGAKLLLNELSEARAALLASLFADAPLTRHNAEYLDDFLDAWLVPDVVIMNPPFSTSPNAHTTSSDVTLRHVTAALSRLREGGRLVTITGESFSPYTASWRASFIALQKHASLRYSIPIGGKLYYKHGTTIETRLTVFDKVPAENAAVFPPALTKAESPEALLAEVLRQSPAFARRPDAQPTTVVPFTRPAAANLFAASDAYVELAYQTKDFQGCDTMSEGIYEPYTLQSITIEDAQPHPSLLVQSAAMASVSPPKPSYNPHVRRSWLTEGILSEAQLESLIYAGKAHSVHLSGWFKLSEHGDYLIVAKEGDERARQYRRGWYLGDGTGCGKGRQVAGIIADNWAKGRRRAVWISENDKLLEDARRDWAALGGNEMDLIPHWKYKQGAEITVSEGILFTTYATLRSAGRGGKKSRLEQITDWLGDEFDGCIMFDEAHAMANAVSSKAGRGTKKASQQGLCGVKLQYALPDARVVYVSATGATTVANLAYAARLGLWGTGDMPFDSQSDFISQMEKGGIAAMEVISRDLKALGLYLARSLSYEGVEYAFLEHALTDEQIHIYDAYAEAFQVIHQNIEAALEATNITSASGETRNGLAKSAVRSAFESNKQRFFNHLLMAMKCPTLIRDMEAQLQDGNAIVIQIVSTNEALMERRLAEIAPSSWNDLDFDITPREYVFDYLMHAFPVHLHQVVLDENGEETTIPARDAEGNPVMCQAALRRRDALVERLALLPAIPGALDQIMHHFGHEQVAEATGRSRRVIKVDDGERSRLCVDNRPASANTAETHAFMDDKKPILVFSKAGGTGRSYHADRGVKNQRRRIHYLLEAGWKADSAIQGLGRTNRTNQVHAPIFRPVATNVKGEKRFLSTIARRLDTLGAITRGQRETGSQGLFREEDNLESIYAKHALRDLLNTIAAGNLPCCSLERFESATGLELRDCAGSVKEDMPPIAQFLNRVLALPITLQNDLFEAFEARIVTRIEQAKESGVYEIGVEVLKADGFRLLEQTPLYTHPATGSVTMANKIERRDRVVPLTVQDALATAQEKHGTLLRNAGSGRIAVSIRAREHIDEQGALIPRVSLIRPLSHSNMDQSQLEDSGWTEVDVATFTECWNKEVAEAPTHRVSSFTLITGTLLPVWKKLSTENMQVCRLQTDDGVQLLGRVVANADIGAVYKQFGLDAAVMLTPDEILSILQQKYTACPLGNGMELRSCLVSGNRRLELTGFREGQLPRLKALGCFPEMIAYKYRLFIPNTAAAAEIIRQVREVI